MHQPGAGQTTPRSYETTRVLDDFARVPHELLAVPQTATAYVPIDGDGIHGRPPNPGHLLPVVDLTARAHVADIDLSPYVAPHGLQIGPDGLLYVTCEDSAVVALVDLERRVLAGAIDTSSANSHCLAISPDGRWLSTENEEDASVSVIDLPGRKLCGRSRPRVRWRAWRSHPTAGFSWPSMTRSRRWC